MYCDRQGFFHSGVFQTDIVRWSTTRFRALMLLITFCAMSVVITAASTATSVTLTTSQKVVNSHPVIGMTARVNPSTVTQGLVRFYDGATLIGTAQIVNKGTKYSIGTANLSAQLSPGAHSLKAVFTGTADYADSTSAVASVNVSGGVTSITIDAGGSVGNYSLTGSVTSTGIKAPTGQVEFLNQTQSNLSLGKATLGSGTLTQNFATAVTYPIFNQPTLHSPTDIATVDVNGDGILDFAVLDTTDGLSIHLGNGDGTFGAATPYCTYGTPPKTCLIGSQPGSIAVADFNGDGIPDFAVGWGAKVSIAIGKGDGTFVQAVNYDVAAGGSEVKIADLDLDGIPDVVASVTHGISVLMGNGDGTFQPHTETSLTDASTYITIGDFNHDDIPDVASAGWNGSHVMVLLGNGNGTFQSELDTKIDINTAGCHILATDLKGTGYPADLALCSGNGILEALIGNGNGAFAAPQKIPVNGTFAEKSSGLASADITTDGSSDLILTWYGSDTDTGRIAVFSNKHDGTGTLNATPVNYYVGHHPNAIATGDFDGDGTLDIAVPNRVDNNTSVLLDKASQKASAVLNNVSVSGSGTQSVFAKYLGDSFYSTATSSTVALQGSGVAAPAITSLSPTSVVAGGAAFTLTVNGSGFASGAVVYWAGAARTTSFVSATQVTAAITAADVAAIGTYGITVKIGTAISNSTNFSVTSAGPAPAITGLYPRYVSVGSAGMNMTVSGKNFVSGSIVYWGSTPLVTTYVSTTKLTAAVPTANLATLGTYFVQVGRPDGGMSNAMDFTVAPPTRYPLAYGYFYKDGSAGWTSGNISCQWVAPSYQCTLTGENFTGSRYTVNATVAETDSPAFIGESASNGKLIIKIFNLSGATTQQPFNIVVFKP